MKRVVPATISTAIVRRKWPLLAVVALVVVAHTIVTRRVRASLRRTEREAAATQLYLADAHQRALDDAALRHSVLTKSTLAADVLARLEKRELALQCNDESDYGMLPILRESFRTLCDNATGVDPALGPLSTYRYYNAEHAGIKSTLITNVWVDVRSAEVFKPIANVSQDGHLHDPRFKHDTVDAYCVCNANQDQSLANGERVWGFIHGDHSWRDQDKWRYCKSIQSSTQIQELQSGFASQPWHKTLSKSNETNLQPPDKRGWPYPVHTVKTNAIIIGRRDDHNPFFQIAVTMNAWIMMQVLDWSPTTTQLVYFDDGLPAVTDELQRRVLAPHYPVVIGRDIMGSVLHFDKALVAPFEYMGPMMRHLDDDEPCGENALVKDFRELVMKQFGVVSEKKNAASCTITVITRQPYQGRIVQRKWLNEDTILDRMRTDYTQNPTFYKYGTCQIQSLDFVNLTLDQQMQAIVESDVVIGMHGAGMVNVLWARPETYVAEIFPKHRHRWGYRNLCYFIGCSWSQFRGGTDTGTGDNASDKIISYADWFDYFDPIIRQAVAELEDRVTQSTW